MKPLGWIAALGLLSGGPACAEVLWTPLYDENPESSDSFDEDWIDPFAIDPKLVEEIKAKLFQVLRHNCDWKTSPLLFRKLRDYDEMIKKHFTHLRKLRTC